MDLSLINTEFSLTSSKGKSWSFCIQQFTDLKALLSHSMNSFAFLSWHLLQIWH